MRVVQTSLHGEGFHLCGIQPEPSSDLCDLRQNHHPGFGGLTLLRDGEFVWTAIRDRESRTLGWIEKKFCVGNPGQWTLEVDGPMVSYTLKRIGDGQWILDSSKQGFA